LPALDLLFFSSGFCHLPSLCICQEGLAMAVESIHVSLKAWHRSGKHVPAAAFVDRVAITPDDPVSKHKGPGHARVDLISKVLDDFEDSPDPSTAFAAHCHDTLQAFIHWLAKQDTVVFEELRKQRCVTEVSIFIVAGESDDSIDLELPPEFMVECGRLGLTLAIAVSPS
jgi:hypothetical protein